MSELEVERKAIKDIISEIVYNIVRLNLATGCNSMDDLDNLIEYHTTDLNKTINDLNKNELEIFKSDLISFLSFVQKENK